MPQKLFIVGLDDEAETSLYFEEVVVVARAENAEQAASLWAAQVLKRWRLPDTPRVVELTADGEAEVLFKIIGSD